MVELNISYWIGVKQAVRIEECAHSRPKEKVSQAGNKTNNPDWVTKFYICSKYSIMPGSWAYCYLKKYLV